MAGSRRHRLGPSGTGTDHWWHQRLSALALVPLTLFLVGLLPSLAASSHEDFVALMRDPLVAAALLLLVGVGLWHMQLGLRTVIEDYVRAEAARLVLRLGLGAVTLALFAAGTVSVLMVAV